MNSPTQNFLGGGGCGCGCFGLMLAALGIGTLAGVYMEMFFGALYTYGGGGLIVVGLLLAIVGVVMYLASFFVQ